MSSPLTLPRFFETVVARYRVRDAAVFGDTRWTYGDLGREARGVARGLVAAGLPPGANVGVLVGNRPEWIAAVFGAAMAGAVAVPLNTFYEQPELDFVVGHCQPWIVFTQERLAGHQYVDALRLAGAERIVAIGGGWDAFVARGTADADAEAEVDWRSAAVRPGDDGVVIYTSGTTAEPKGVLHTHRAPVLQSWRFARLLGIRGGDRVWSAFPFFWSAGFAMVVGGTLAAGGCLVLQETFDAGDALRLLEQERVTTPHAWAHQHAALEDHPDWLKRDLSALRNVEAFGPFGRHPTVNVDDVWSPRAAYGLTETFTIISALPADAPAALRERVHGRVLPGNRVRIGDDGEIAVKGPTLMKGYVGMPAESCFDSDGYFHSGDAGYVDDEGYLHWTGRTTELIKTGGANVSPVEIGEALLRHPGLKAALAVGVPDPLLGERVVVCAVRHEGSDVDEEGVRAYLRGRVAAYKIPHRVLFVADHELPMTSNAKIRAEKLRALAAERLKEQT